MTKSKKTPLTSNPTATGKSTGADSFVTENKKNTEQSVVGHSPHYHIFSHSIQRSKNLLKVHDEVHGKRSKPEKHLSDVHRAAIVLAISALDAFISRFVTSKITILLSDDTKELPPALLNKIREATEKPKQGLIVEAVRKNNIRQIVEKMLQEEYEKKTFQGTETIEDCMKIVGYENIFKTIASNARMNEDDLKKDLNSFTKRRHTIVHRGDFDSKDNPPKTENSITKAYANKCISLIEKIAKHINELK